MTVKAQTQTVTMATQVFPELTTMNTSLSTQFTQCLGSQILGQEMVWKLAPQQISHMHMHAHTHTTHTHTHVHTQHTHTYTHTDTHTHTHTHTLFCDVCCYK